MQNTRSPTQTHNVIDTVGREEVVLLGVVVYRLCPDTHGGQARGDGHWFTDQDEKIVSSHVSEVSGKF
eukprot:341097-Amorphochlora_amoeboformis.AAC.1